MPVLVELLGAPKIIEDLDVMAGRLASAGEMLTAEFSVLEQAEATLFDSYGGEYVASGATRDSLTQPSANGAIRRIHGNEIEFGTSIWYAHFQRTIGGPSGKPRGRKREGPSKILKLTPAARQAAAQLVMDRVMGRV